MTDDNTQVWERLQVQQRDIEALKTASARHEARLDATESRTDQMMREMAEMRGESRQHHSEVTTKVSALQQSVQQGIGALRFGGWMTGVVVGLLTVAATLAAYFWH